MQSTTRFGGIPALTPMPRPLSLDGRYAYPLALAGFALLVYLSAVLCLQLALPDTLITPVWPVTGLAFGILYLHGYRLWPALFVGLAAAFLHAVDAHGLDTASRYVLVVGPAAVYTLEAACAVWLVRRIAGPRALLDRPINVFRFVTVIALVAAAGSSLVNIIVSAGIEPQNGELLLWLTQWLGSVGGTVLVAPAIVAATASYAARQSATRLIETSAALLVTVVAAQVLFTAWPLAALQEPLPLPVIVPLLWIVIRLGVRELSLALLLVGFLALRATLMGAGPYPAATLHESLLLTQVFLIVTAAGFYTVAAALLENHRATEALRDMNATLEQRVRQRTDALAQANHELQNYRDRLEDLVAERTADLELAKTEIESFSYSVSHDLRSPLRAIDGYSHALIEDYGDQLDAKALGYLERSRAASQRMGLLIDDVLLLSRVTRHELELHRVDLTVLAREVIARIEEADAARNVEFVVHEDLSVQGDEHLLRIVLENLLGNAWKYSARTERACIEFGMNEESDGEYIFFVRDNGIGFDMHYSDQLFGAFQRLHSPDEFEGTGIGLATVARVMTRHGGRVWAEGAVNHGATFYFAFPERGRTTGPRKAISQEDIDACMAPRRAQA